MSQLTIDQVVQVAYDAGFRGDALVTVVAIAHGESGLRAGAVGDEGLVTSKWGPSVGLFQVRTLRDETGTGGWRDIQQHQSPLFNARAAFEISSGGTNFKPWSVYNHDIHHRYLDDSRAAVTRLERSGELARGGVAVPDIVTMEFGDGASGDFAGSGGVAPFMASPARPSEADLRLQTFIEAALAQEGDRYAVVEVDLDDPDPDVFDCSELVEWAARRAGIEITDNSWMQYQELDAAGSLMTVEEAFRTPGALLFRFNETPSGWQKPNDSHVAISLGDGRTIEAMGTKWGVTIDQDATDRKWTHAGTIPGMGTRLPTTESTSMEGVPYELDTDGDGLRDRLEMFIGTDPYAGDTDRDGFSDADELLEYQTDPLDYHSSGLIDDSADPDWRPPLTNAASDPEVLPRLIVSNAVPATPQPAPAPAPAPEPPAPEPPAPEPPAPEPPGAADEVAAEIAPIGGVDSFEVDQAVGAPTEFAELRAKLVDAFGAPADGLLRDDLQLFEEPTAESYADLRADHAWLPTNLDEFLTALGLSDL